MQRRSVLLGGLLVLLAGCSGNWEVAYDNGIDASVSRNWHVHNVMVVAPESLTVSNANTFAPNADIVWHGEPYGNRRTQVAEIVKEGILRGTSVLNGQRDVTIVANIRHFHSVTPLAMSQAPGAVHNIRYVARVMDTETGEFLTEPEEISADLEAYVGAAAITAALESNTAKVRIVNHIARVTRGWLGVGPDQRRRFSGVGR